MGRQQLQLMRTGASSAQTALLRAHQSTEARTEARTWWADSSCSSCGPAPCRRTSSRNASNAASSEPSGTFHWNSVRRLCSVMMRVAPAARSARSCRIRPASSALRVCAVGAYVIDGSPCNHSYSRYSCIRRLGYFKLGLQGSWGTWSEQQHSTLDLPSLAQRRRLAAAAHSRAARCLPIQCRQSVTV